jgi:hypothetical protein
LGQSQLLQEESREQRDGEQLNFFHDLTPGCSNFGDDEPKQIKLPSQFFAIRKPSG